jgi:hypothetical protein
MKTFIIIFGIFIIVMAGFMLLRPKDFGATLMKYSEALWMHILAVAVRLAFGIVLVLYADQSRFPLALQIIGWIGIAAGVILAFTPRAKFTQLVKWAFERFSAYIQIAAFSALLFGGFLIYAVQG